MAGSRHPHPEAIYFHTAADALKMAKHETDEFKRAQLGAITMVFSALCLEAYINQVFHKSEAGRRELQAKPRMSLEDKWFIFPKLLKSPTTFVKAAEPYKTFIELVRLRNNRLVHLKPSRETEKSDSPLPNAFLSDLLKDTDRAGRYVVCVEEMIKELSKLTKIKLPNFIKEKSRYTARVTASFTFPL